MSKHHRKLARGAGPSLIALAAMLGLGLVLAPLPRLMAAEEKPLVVGVDGTFAPHAMPKLGGGVEGFNVDMAEDIGRRLGRPVQIVAQEYSGLIPGLNAGKFDFLAAPTTVTPERARVLLFTEGYLDTDFQFLIPRDSPDIKSLDDLKGKVIAVNKGSAYDAWARQNQAKYGFEFQSYGTNSDAVQAVLSGRAFANLAGNTVVAYAATRNPSLKLSYVIRTGLVWSIPFRKDDAAMRDRVEQAVECMKLDGTFARLHEKWFGIKPEPGSAALTVSVGYGVPGMEGYEAEAYHIPRCR